MPKLLLIQPSQYLKNGGLIKQKRLYLPGLVFPLLAAMLPNRWEVEIKLEVIEEVDFDADVDLVGIGSMGHSIFRAFDIAEEFRKRKKKVFIGGYMASMVPKLTLQHVDSLIIGDGEISLMKLLHDFETKGELETIYQNPLKELNHLPIPRYEILTKKKIGDMLPVQAGRGCNHICSFCSIACLYKGKHFVRPINEVIRDISKIKALGFHKFYMIDDNIVANPQYLEQLCAKIKPLKMKWSSQCTVSLAYDEQLLKRVADSGCEILSLGIESISQQGMNKLKKGWLRVSEHEKLIGNFRKAGIMVSAEMIIGTDGDTIESLRETIHFINRAKLPLVRIYILTPVPSTGLYAELKAHDRLIHENYKMYTSAECVHYPHKILPKELNATYAWMNKRIFSIFGIINRVILNKGFLHHPIKHLFAFAVNLHYRSYVKKGETPLIV